MNRRNKVGFLVPLVCLALAVVSAAKADPAPINSQPIENPRLVVPENLMQFSRLPLTYIQESIPFFGERNIIFFGRLEADYAHYSSGILEDDSGFALRRFRLGLAGKVKLWTKLEIYSPEKNNDGSSPSGREQLLARSDSGTK